MFWSLPMFHKKGIYDQYQVMTQVAKKLQEQTGLFGKEDDNNQISLNFNSDLAT